MMPAFGVALLFWHLIAPFWVWRRWRMQPTKTRQIFLLCLGFCLILAVWVALFFISMKEWLLPAVLGFLWVAHLSAWLARRLFDGEKLAPDLCPEKTWTGVYGALAGVVVYTLIGILWIIEPEDRIENIVFRSLWNTVLFALLLAVLGILGERFVALARRQASGACDLLPGYGAALAVLPCFMFDMFLGVQV
jgi:phosphatidate cytidylyltransferase